MSVSRPVLAALTSVATVVTAGAVLAPVHANTTGTNLVISEVYGAGGNSGAVYNADFVELYNPTGAAISLSGMSVHYRSASGSSGGSPYALSGSVPAHAHYLIQMGAAGANGAALPTPDAVASPAFSMAAAGGQTYLLNGTTAVTSSGDQKGNPSVVDMVGVAGSTSFETAPTTAGATASSSLNRSASGADSDDNSADLTLAAPTPEPAGGSQPPQEFDGTIAQIQGTDSATSPHAGETVTTRGVVTAAYPTGGFNGFYIQTPGTGGTSDATPGASDAIFVYGSAATALVHIGDYVQVHGPVKEFAGTTEITPDASGVTQLSDAHDPVTPAAIAYPTTEAAREAHEGELLAPTDRFTVTDNYDTNTYAEIGLATGDHQLVQPTDVVPASDTAGIAAIQADNAARAVTLDDGASVNYTGAGKDTPMPWLSHDNPIRIGSAATLQSPVVLEYRNGTWDFQPTSQVTGTGASVATFSDTRSANQAPAAVGGDLKIATFNVLNYFNTTGEDWVSRGHTCSYYYDRAGDPLTDKTCSDNGPRGAAQSSGGTDLTDPRADVERQRAKEVRAINTMDADVVSLEEIENSVALGEADRDDALRSLVDALNADAGTTRWAFVPSPDASQLPPLAEQDVIRTAFIYNPAAVTPVGPSVVLADQSDPGEPFENAREPLAQEFKRKGALDADGFLVIVNHFKSKGDSSPPATGDNANGIQGAFNGDRVRQAHALVDFAQQVSASRGTDKVFLVGDFNSYTREDPIQVLEDAGYVNQASDDSRDVSYEYSGLAGSLDHVLASPAAAATVTGRDVWQVNAEESVGFEYSRYNDNATLLYAPDQFRASDHNPEIVGLSAPYSQEDATVTVTATPSVLKKKKGTSTIKATVTAAHSTPSGTVEFYLDGTLVRTVALVGGAASTVVGPFPSAGRHHVEVRYLGDTTTRPATAAVDLTVTNAG